MCIADGGSNLPASCKPATQTGSKVELTPQDIYFQSFRRFDTLYFTAKEVVMLDCLPILTLSTAVPIYRVFHDFRA